MINASTMALMNTGIIPMRGVVCAISVGRLRFTNESSTTLVLDPSDDELPSLGGGGCFAFLFSTGQKGGSQVVWNDWQSKTPFTEQELRDARELARGGAEKVWKCMKKAIGGVGVGKAVLEQRSNEEQKYESGSEDESDDDEMEI
jgi:exosome complex component RRP46